MPGAAATRRTTLTLGRMPAVHAVRAVEFALSAVPGVSALDVSLGRAVVDHAERVTLDDLRRAVELAGCTVEAVAVTRAPLPLVE